MTSELVTNAIVHPRPSGQTDVVVHVHVDVSDVVVLTVPFTVNAT